MCGWVEATVTRAMERTVVADCVSLLGTNWPTSLTWSGWFSHVVRLRPFFLLTLSYLKLRSTSDALTYSYPGSSNGRAPRCAAWFLEHVREVAEDMDMNVMVLEGGIKGWVKAGTQFTQLMDGYKPEYWKELFEEEEAKKNGTGSAGETKALSGQGDVGK